MREIKFRGKSKDINVLIYGDLIHKNDKIYIDYWCSLLKEDDKISKCGYVEREVIPETIGQYIGKKDINRKEIYSGDILRDTEGNFKNIIVCYDEETDSWIDQFECKYIWQTLKEGRFEIIGNIYENGELVKQGSEL